MTMRRRLMFAMVGLVAVVTLGGHHEEVVRELLVDRRVAGDLHRGQHLGREADEADAEAERVVALGALLLTSCPVAIS